MKGIGLVSPSARGSVARTGFRRAKRAKSGPGRERWSEMHVGRELRSTALNADPSLARPAGSAPGSAADPQSISSSLPGVVRPEPPHTNHRPAARNRVVVTGARATSSLAGETDE